MIYLWFATVIIVIFKMDPDVEFVIKLLHNLYSDRFVFANDKLYYFSNNKWILIWINTFYYINQLLYTKIDYGIEYKLMKKKFQFKICNSANIFCNSKIIINDFNLIGFENGVYDIDSQKFRLYKPKDAIKIFINYDYYDILVKHITKIKDNFDEWFPDIAVRNYVMKILAYCLFECYQELNYYIFFGKYLFQFFHSIQTIFENIGINNYFNGNSKINTYNGTHKKIFVFMFTPILKCMLNGNDNENVRIIKVKYCARKIKSTHISSILHVLLQYYDLYKKEGITEVKSIMQKTEKFRHKQIAQKLIYK